jgi:hypothetical protein
LGTFFCGSAEFVILGTVKDLCGPNGSLKYLVVKTKLSEARTPSLQLYSGGIAVCVISMG